ncbi:MAG TPA: hypothetical protein VGM78_11400 [Ilumatobacteraceae bacterium]
MAIAIAIGSLFVTTASPIIAGDATLQRTLAAVPIGQRSVTVAVTLDGLSSTDLSTINSQVRASLRAPELGPSRTELAYQTLAASDGSLFRMAGIDGLAQHVRLIDGRLPQSCAPARCEVVIAGSTPAIALQPELGLVVVGHVALTDDSLLAGNFAPNSDTTVLLADGVSAAGAVKSLELIGRSVGWVSPIDPTAMHVKDIDHLLSAAAEITNEPIQGSPTVVLPRDELLDAKARGATASHRVALAAAQGVVLLGAFVLLAAASARRQHRAARDLLRQRGAGRATANVFTVCEAAWPVVIGLVLGLPLGIAATAELADHWGFSTGSLVSTVLHRSASTVVGGALLLLIATAIVMAAAPTRTAGAPARRPWWRPSPIDGLGIAALCMAALATSRGSATPSTLVSSGDPLIALLPLLASIVVAWIAVRVAPPFIAACARVLRGRAPLTRTALDEVSRRPVVPLVTAGFLAAATMLGIFSLGYRATLAAGAHDQAAFEVPYDFSLAYGPALVRPSAVVPSGGFGAIVSSATSTEVLRQSASVQSETLSVDSVDVVGVDPHTLGSLRGWRSDFGPSIASVRNAITAPAQPAVEGTPIPAGATTLRVSGSGDLSVTAIKAVVAGADGNWHEDETTLASDGTTIVVALDPGDAGGQLIGFRLGQTDTQEQKTQHHAGEGNTGAEFFTATVTMTAVSAVDHAGTAHPLAVAWSNLDSDGAVVTHLGTGVTLDLRLEGSSALLLPARPADLDAIPAIVDPQTAANAQGGVVVIDLPDDSRQTLRVAGVAKRFPGAPDRFAIVDIALASPAFNFVQPGLGTPNEIWIATAARDRAAFAAALAKAPFDQVAVASREAIQHDLSSDPLARFTLGLFGVSAAIAAILAVAAIYLSTVSNAAEEAPLHRALAAEGVAPRSLSSMVRTTAIAIATTALIIGALGSLVVLHLVTRIIAVTATSTVPVPPLLVDISASNLIGVVVALLVPCALAASVAAHGAKRVASGDLLREFG